ncbi:MAG TPA: serine hydrolase domain-containing protein [Caulobacteraceae bacterium]|jgi:CubicO group peptidase (beta-lactamase class C family)|nr:serine hydrolase domain-containing protein [Caulobacteraceae bacterium]
MTTRRSFLGVAGAAALGATSPAEARPDAAAFAALVKSYADRAFTDGVVLMARHGRPVFEMAVGYADRARKIRNDMRTVFHIGSITKQFTAAAVLKLADAGALSVNDRIAKFIPEAPASWRDVTVQHLLAHTSGIPNHTAVLGDKFDSWMGKEPEDVIALVRDLPLEAAPGTRFKYDNTGYVLLGLIVERVSRETLDDFMRKRLFDPLGMIHTGLATDTPPPYHAVGNLEDHGKWVATAWAVNVRASGAGAIYSTAGDLVKWEDALFAGRVLSSASTKAMFTDWGHGFGYGWVTDKVAGHPAWWHNGHGAGYGAVIYRVPDLDLTVIVMSNDDEARIEPLAKGLIGQFAAGRK